MKKKIIMIVACVMCCAGLFGGCGQSGMKQDNTAISNSEEGKQEGTTEEKEVTGTMNTDISTADRLHIICTTLDGLVKIKEAENRYTC